MAEPSAEAASEVGFGLAVQQLARATHQVLVLGQLSGYRRGDRWFEVENIEQLFEDLRIPAPNVPRAIRNLVSSGMVRGARGAGRFSLTPLGDRKVSELVGNLDADALAPLLSTVPGAEFGHAIHTVIPPSLAPMKWAEGIKALLDRFEFNISVLCMTRFPGEDESELPDPIAGVIQTARRVLSGHGLHLHLASDRQIDDDLWGNVAAHAWASRYGIGLFEDRAREGINPNLVIEVGAMMMIGRRCALLRDQTVEQMPTDLVGRIYKPVDFDDQTGVSEELHNWCAEDLSLGRCSSCPSA